MFREAGKDSKDYRFVYDSWLKSLWPQHQSIQDYWECQKWLIDAILDRSHVLLACDEVDSKVIFGYAVYDDDMVHWVYVKHPLRRHGLASRIVDQIPHHSKFFHSHETRHGKFLKKKYNSILDPYVAAREARRDR